MASKPMCEIWAERAIEAFEKGDLDAAETRLIISDHLRPNAEVKRLLKLVRQRKINHNPVADFSQFRDRKVDSEECIIIAKLAIERGDFEQAKKFLILAEKNCPGYYSKKLLKKIKKLENLRIRQLAKKGFAEKYIEDARVHLEVGNFEKAKKLLIKSQKVFSTIQAQRLLRQVEEAINYERRHTQNNTTNRQKTCLNLLLYLLNILTCNCLKGLGYVRFDNEHSNTNRSRNSSHYTFNADDLPYYGEFPRGNNSRSEARDNSRPNTSAGHSRTEQNRDNRTGNPGNAEGSRNSTQYNFSSENISGNNTNNARHQRSTQYSYTSDNIPGNNARSNNNNTYSTRYSHTFNSNDENARTATGARNNTQGNNAESSRNNNESRRNNRQGPESNTQSSSNNAQNSRNNTQNAGSNSQSSRNNTQSAGNNTQNSRNNTQNSRNNTQNAGNSTQNARNNTQNSGNNTQSSRNNTQNAGSNTQRSRRNTDHSSSNMRGAEDRRNFELYTFAQFIAVSNVLRAKNDYDRLGLQQGATEKEIRQAFRKLSLLLHPDKNKAPKAKEAFMVVSEAKDRLLKIVNL